MKPVSVLLALLTLGVALTAVAWVTQEKPLEETAEETTQETVAPGVAKQAKENPFEFSESGPFPKAVADNNMHEFGSMELGTTEHHRFIIQNEGEAPLKLKVGPVQCKCTVAELNADEVAPGESAEIEIDWKPEALATEFHQKAVIFTNDPENPQIELHVKGAVESLAMMSPQGVWMLDRLEEGQKKEFTGYVMSRHLEEFEILGYESSSEFVTCEFEPLSEKLKERRDVKSGYEVHCTIEDGMPVGRFQATVTVQTDMKGGKDFPIQLEGIRHGPFSIIGENWIGGKMLVAVGDVNQADGKTVKLSMFISREDEPVEFEVVSSDPPFLDLRFEKDESFDVPTREKLWMILTVPPDAPLGRWPADKPGTILVKSNRESMSEFEIHAGLTVTN